MKINLDIDGVLYNFMDNFMAWNGLMVDPTQWNCWESWDGWTKEGFYETLKDDVRDGIYCLEDIAFNTRYCIVGWRRDLGAEISLVTHRLLEGVEATAAAQTFQWVEDSKLVVDGVCLLAPTASKANHFADVVIDDNPNTATWAVAGALNLLFNRPWNQEPETEPHMNVKRVFTWPEIDLLVRERAKWLASIEKGMDDCIWASNS